MGFISQLFARGLLAGLQTPGSRLQTPCCGWIPRNNLFGIIGILTSALHLRLHLENEVGFMGFTYFHPQIFSYTTLFSPTVVHDKDKLSLSLTLLLSLAYLLSLSLSFSLFRWTGFRGRIGGILIDKENVAITSKEQQMLKDMLRVPDSKGLTV